MTSSRQFEANRRNSTRSTGPITEAGKDRSRRNGLCAETIVGRLEDVEDYKGFEAAIIATMTARPRSNANWPAKNSQVPVAPRLGRLELATS